MLLRASSEVCRRSTSFFREAGRAIAVSTAVTTRTASARRRRPRCPGRTLPAAERPSEVCHRAVIGPLRDGEERSPIGRLGGLALQQGLAHRGVERQFLGVAGAAVGALDVATDGLVVGVEVDDRQPVLTAPWAGIEGGHL